MIRWIESISEWDGRLPAVLIVSNADPEERHGLAVVLVAATLGVDPDSIAIDRPEGLPPTVARPAECGLVLSMASRGGLAAVAVAASPIGVDVELAEPAGEIPWNVLHPAETAMLARQDEGSRASAFARLWSLKEAYLKALGIGLWREPASFAVSFVDEESSAFRDPAAPMTVAEAKTRLRRLGGTSAAVSVVMLEREAGGYPLQAD